MCLPLMIDFSETESIPADSLRIIFWGDSNDMSARWGAVGADSMDDACLAEKQTITISFGFARPRKCGQIKKFIKQLEALMQANSWKFKHEDVGPLVDTDDREFWGTPEEKFPRTPSWGGYNASRGFTLDFEKEGTNPEFSEEELASLQKLAEDFAESVFGRRLPESGKF